MVMIDRISVHIKKEKHHKEWLEYLIKNGETNNWILDIHRKKMEFASKKLKEYGYNG